MLGPAFSVVAFGLLASLVWGAADYGGGIASRRAPVLGVLLFTQLVGLVCALGLALGSNEPGIGPADLAIAAVAGLLGMTGLSLLYRGLSVGRMGVVAPVGGVISALVPTVAGIILEGLPAPMVVAGIALAIIGVVLVSASGEDPGGRPSGLGHALAAGIFMGAFSFLISRVSHDLVFWPLVAVRAVEAVVFLGIVLLARPAWRVPRGLWLTILGVGILDMLGNASYLTAVHVGPLAVAAVLSSLYPVVTVILATILLREHVTRAHAVGILTVAVAIALIAGGSAA